jgi:endonuclease/exonuclease/phosphatase family metal-dependent hydrolase
MPRGQPFRVLVWNVQYAGSRRHRFFYDGGRAARVPVEDVRATLSAIARAVHEAAPDVILWQELDRGSDRTARIDQHDALRRAGDLPFHVSTAYHRVPWLPVPAWEPLGRVDLHLSVFSRWPIATATHHGLPLLAEPPLRQAFNLRRAVLEAVIPAQGGGALRVLDTHLSAFSHGDGTLARQIARLDALADQADVTGDAWLLAGDLNALPPGDDPARLGADAAEYPERPTPAQALFDRRRAAIPAATSVADPARWGTYLPFGADRPDRTIDHAFLGGPVTLLDARPLPVHDVSDHAPLLLTLRLPER